MRQLFSEGPSTSFGQREDQVAATRRTLQQMNAAANRAIDFHVTRSQFGPKDQVAETRRVLEEMNAAADRAIDDQVAARRR